VPAPVDYDGGEVGGMIFAGKTEVLGENLSQCRFVHHKPHMLCPDANPGRSGGKPATNRLSYDTTLTHCCVGFIKVINVQNDKT
jgi:hypothetical protein